MQDKDGTAGYKVEVKNSLEWKRYKLGFWNWRIHTTMGLVKMFFQVLP